MYIGRLFWGKKKGLAKLWPKEERLRKFGIDKGREGVQNLKNLVNVICTSSLTRLTNTFRFLVVVILLNAIISADNLLTLSISLDQEIYEFIRTWKYLHITIEWKWLFI